MIPYRLTVRVPATTANLGPGFDTFGLALDLWNEAVFELSGMGFKVDFNGSQSDELPRDGDNLIAKAFAFLYQKQEAVLPIGVHITCTNRIPTGSGLGSSASAVLAGLSAANAFLGYPYNAECLLVLAAEMEGHPDNAAAAIYGGLTVSLCEDEKLMTLRYEVPPVSVAIVVPKFDLPTQTARAALPQQVSIKDAVYNIGRAVLVVDALRLGDLDLLGEVMKDRLHQPYRFQLIPGCLEARDAALETGAKAVVLSGAGPGLLAFAPADACFKIALAMQEQFGKAGLTCESFVLSVSPKGLDVQTGQG